MIPTNGVNVKLRSLAAVAAVVLTGAGCGASTPPESRPAQQRATGQDEAVKFAECMRANGVPDFPDPDAKGDFEYGVSVTPAVFTKAQEACEDLKPPGALSSARSPEEQSTALRFADCIRSHGVKDFPDPVEGEPLVNTYKIPSSDTPDGMTILNAAMAECADVVEDK